MATTILIIGESGSGKSTSIRTLNSTETFIINILNKPLPFKGWQKSYKEGTYQEFLDKKTNMTTSDNYLKIQNILTEINQNRPDIKTIIIDDFQYIMVNEFMNRATETGYKKFSEIGQHTWCLAILSQSLRKDLNIIFLAHAEIGDDGISRMKTIGKLLKEKVTFEGMFTLVLQAVILEENKYSFLTHGNPTTIAKTPMDMFNESYIPNDLQKVITTINEYNKEEEPENKKKQTQSLNLKIIGENHDTIQL